MEIEDSKVSSCCQGICEKPELSNHVLAHFICYSLFETQAEGIEWSPIC